MYRKKYKIWKYKTPWQIKTDLPLFGLLPSARFFFNNI